MKTKQLNRKSRISHVTRGNVLADLELDPTTELELRLKAEIHHGLLQLVARRGYKPRQLEKLFDVPQSRVSELLRGKLSLISVKRLLEYMHRLGGRVQVKVKYDKAA